MFVLTTLVYPLVLALLCAGAGLLVDRLSGRVLPSALIVTAGAAALITVSQLTTFVVAFAPATPAVMAAVALGGFALAWHGEPQWWRAATSRSSLRQATFGWPGVSALVYLVALAPVLLAGRATFSSFMALSDSAFHLIGADYLLHHGQSYSHLDLNNSYGQFINNYYNSSYPSGADTLFGGSAFLLRLPLIWAFQPFVAFMLASAVGPAWLLVRRAGLERAWASAAALCMALPALVYAYQLIGSIKEITALALILGLGALAAADRRWLVGPARGVIPFALVSAAGVSALGVGFGAWVLAAALVALGALVSSAHARSPAAPSADGGDGPPHAQARTAVLVALGAVVLVVCALPTWVHARGSLTVTKNVAATSNPGNLARPLHAVQSLGVWLHGSYKLAPGGDARVLTDILIVLSLAACVVGLVYLVRTRRWALAGWIVLVLIVWLIIGASSTTWVAAKTLMLSSPAVVLLAWAGVAAVRASPLRAGAPLLALTLVGGVLASDTFQYRTSDLAPTARYEELASLNARFAGRGPVLFTGFDEYSMYELRNLDVGGPDFVYPPTALAALAGGYGRPVDLDRASPASLRAYPLIIMARDPAASRPPAAYTLAWQGTYYEVWARRPGAPSAIAHVALSGGSQAQCAQIARVAALPAARGTRLVAATAPPLLRIAAASAAHPAGWGRERAGLVLSSPGSLSASFALPSRGSWSVWLQGRLMPAVTVSVDGRQLGTIAGQLAGNSLVPDTMTPLSAVLAAGEHQLKITRTGFTLAPGDRGTAVLDGVLIGPAGTTVALRSVPVSAWRSLCGGSYQWIELVPA